MNNVADVIGYYFHIGGGTHVVIFLGITISYLVARGEIALIQLAATKKQKAKDDLRAVVKALLALVLMCGIIFPAVILLMEKVVTKNHSLTTILRNDAALLELDYHLFGTYLPFWLQDTRNPIKPVFDSLSDTLIITYKSLTIVLETMFILLAIRSGRLLAQGVTAFFLCAILSAPFWYGYPVFSPIAYVMPEIHHSLPPRLQTALAHYQPAPALQNYLLGAAAYHMSLPAHVFPITNMPSMHVAWATVLLYFSARLWRPLVAFTAPYFVLTVLSTLYTLQHYTFDLPTGIMAGIAAIGGAHLLSRSWVFTPQNTVQNILQQDLQRLQAFVKGLDLF